MMKLFTRSVGTHRQAGILPLLNIDNKSILKMDNLYIEDGIHHEILNLLMKCMILRPKITSDYPPFAQKS